MPLERISIAIFVNKFTLGGAQFQGLCYARALRSLGFDPVLFTLDATGSLAQQLADEGFDFQEVPFDPAGFHKNIWGKIRCIAKCAALFRAHHIKVVIPFTYYPNLIGILAARLAGIKYRFWNERGMDQQMRLSSTERLAKSFVSRFLANSHAVRDYLGERNGVDPGNIVVIPNVYQERSSKHSGTAWRQKLGVKKDDFVITMLANFFPVKDHVTALRGFHIISDKYPCAKLVLAGYAPNESRFHEMKSLAFDLGLCGQVLFPESVDDVGGLLAATDVGILCTDMEGSPNAILDYMVAGLPVLGSDIPPVRELVENVGSEWLFGPKDAEELAHKLERLLEDNLLRQRAGESNQRYVLEHHAPGQLLENLRRFISEYTDLLNAGGCAKQDCERK